METQNNIESQFTVLHPSASMLLCLSSDISACLGRGISKVGRNEEPDDDGNEFELLVWAGLDDDTRDFVVVQSYLFAVWAVVITPRSDSECNLVCKIVERCKQYGVVAVVR